MSEHTQRILLVEDDQNFGDVLKSYLEMNNYEVILAKDGVAGMEQYRDGKFDLGIFDIMMPRKDGLTLASEIREKDKSLPIIFLTAKNMKEDILQGFRHGGDDYITKPFSSEELLLRIQALLKRSAHKSAPEADARDYYIGKYHFNFPLRTLTFVDDPTDEEKLSPKEAMLMKMFALKPNDVLERTDALVKIWGEDNYFTARSMDVFITKIRKYLKRDPNIEIINIHGNGFQLMVKEEANTESSD